MQSAFFLACFFVSGSFEADPSGQAAFSVRYEAAEV